MTPDRIGSIPDLSLDQVVKLLEMRPHPEGGFYRETFRDSECDEAGRAASTAIYYLLPGGEVSAWHRVGAVEIWHWYAGGPLVLSIAGDDGARQEIKLGPDLAGGERPQGVVPRHAWQSAKSMGPWTLVGCTVAPGFEFSGFEMAPEGFEP
ncbi:cupin domain-containing protein [Rhizobiales bacterium]|uniref:cupin domain-containing protein n=1 Tax=Hongsoonwoonella zoysiae TaxID=2821844 RepID=UPI0015617BCA|nr:cupin domain-containing protein [Hongsoonwoonella zoysiae]NRG17090.1 cupin domain-containing protein [Hongsoonwoonella zoysiae]